MTSKIIVLGFEHQYGAEGMYEEIEKFEQDGLITLEDAVIASRGVGLNVEIKQARKQEGKAALKGGGVGLLAGLLLGGPILGAAAGAGIAAIARSVKDSGLDDKFIDEVTDGLTPESSALFLLVKEANAEELQGKLDQFEAKLLTTTLDPDREEALREMLDK